MQIQVDKRSSPRIDVDFPIRLFPDNIEVNVLNISEAGMYLTLQSPLSDNRNSITFVSSQREFSKMSFRVVWERHLEGEKQYNYGVCFTEVNEQAIEQIREFVIRNEIEEIIKNLPDENSKSTILNFFIEDFKAFVGFLDKLRKNAIPWIAEKQNVVDTYSHAVVAKGEFLIKGITDRKTFKKIKKKFRTLVGMLPYKSTLMSQALNKPYGYPGDFYLIEKIYNNEPLSEDNAKYFDLIFLNNPYAQAVRSRKEKMKEILAAFIEGETSSPINIFNLGCGPCREIRELFITGGFKTNKEIHFNLLDQDGKALEYARDLLSSSKDIVQNIQYNFIKEDVFSFLKGSFYNTMIEKQHLVYTIGLADYLPDRILKKVIKGYFNLLVKGGGYVLAHKDKSKDSHAPVFPDWFCDWHFVTRNEKYLVELIQDIGLKNFSIERAIESTGKIIFLYIKKIS